MNKLKLKSRRINTYTEKRTITALIVSTEFLQQVEHLIQFTYFQSHYTKTIAKWCMEFYEVYGKAPFENIQDIYEQRIGELKEEEADLVKYLLLDINKKYEFDKGINVPYVLDKTIEFFKKRELEITTGNMQILLDKNDLEGAEAQIAQFNKIAKVSANWVASLSPEGMPERVREIFAEDNRLFQMTGDVGKYMGSMDRGWLVAIAAAFKRGKTFYLQEIAVEAVFKKLKVAFISLEMHEKDSHERLFKRIVGVGDTYGGDDTFPCFDCYLNQADTCDRPERPTQIQLLDEDGVKPDFDPNSEYLPCTHCKDDPKLKREFVVDTWWEVIKRPPFNETQVVKHMTSVGNMYGKYFMFKKYPRFSASVSDMMRDLDTLERMEGFIPDVIIIDYADILKAEDTNASSTEQLDATWKTLSRLAGERHALVITASQVNRGALNKKQTEAGDLAMWIGKLGHVDAMYTLNQTNPEKNRGVIRVGTMVKRFDEFDPERDCMILQKLKHGQFCLDSYY